jgi:hypothetical protein
MVIEQDPAIGRAQFRQFSQSGQVQFEVGVTCPSAQVDSAPFIIACNSNSQLEQKLRNIKQKLTQTMV